MLTLHIHKDETDNLDLCNVANELFVLVIVKLCLDVFKNYIYFTIILCNKL